MKNIYLVQTGTMKEISTEDVTGIDCQVSYNYMGSAEFEFGALNKSLKRILLKIEDYFITPISAQEIKTPNGQPIRIICGKNCLADIIDFIKREVSGKDVRRTKERTDIYEIFNVLQKPRKSYTHWRTSISKTNFWWDVENDWMMIYNKKHADDLFFGLQKLKERFDRKEILQNTNVDVW